jgi:hypothetical protein
MDDDLFVFRPQVILDLLKHMETTEKDMCGIPDGGNDTIRGVLNPASMNPFFNIMNLEAIRRKTGLAAARDFSSVVESSLSPFGIPWSPELVSRVPAAFKPGGSECPHLTLKWAPCQEDYYTIFFQLLRDVNVLFLRAETGPDGITTIVKDLAGKPWAFHTWFARGYGSLDGSCPEDPNNFARINHVIAQARLLLESFGTFDNAPETQASTSNA